MPHHAGDVHARAVHVVHDHRDVRVTDERRQLLLHWSRLLRRQAFRLHVADQGKRDLAVPGWARCGKSSAPSRRRPRPRPRGFSRNSVMCLTSSSCTAAACEQPTATAPIAIQIPTLLDMLPPPPPRGRHRADRSTRHCQRQAVTSGAPSAPLQSPDQPAAGAPPPSRRSSGAGFRDRERAFSPAHLRPALVRPWLAFRLIGDPLGTKAAREGKGAGRCSGRSQQQPSCSAFTRTHSSGRRSPDGSRSRSCCSSWGRCS